MKKLLPIIAGVIVIIVILIIFLISKNNGKKNPEVSVTPAPNNNQQIEKLSPDSLDVLFEPRGDKKAFTIIIKGLKEKNYNQFEYEISYDAQSSEDPTQIITQGSASREPVLVTDKDFEREILLGTCSKNVCKYDKGVKNILIVLKLTDNQAKVKLWEKEFSLE